MAGDRDHLRGDAVAAVPGWKRFTVGKNRCVHANQGSRPCPLDKAEKKLAKHGDWEVDVGRFLGLHADGQNLVRGWIEKAAKSKPGDEFEAFIYAWIGFNGWASCCCAEDGDTAQLHMMMLDEGCVRTNSAPFHCQLVLDSETEHLQPSNSPGGAVARTLCAFGVADLTRGRRLYACPRSGRLPRSAS
jgi:hypothetical protein